MSELELIGKQQIEIEKLRSLLSDTNTILDELHRKFYGIGQPLNDNILQFNDAQLKWCASVFRLIEQINTKK